MFFVRARATGPWRTIDRLDVHAQKFGEKYLVMAAEQNRWCVNNVGVDVRPGLCVSFLDAHEADWFLQQRKGQFVSVEPESVVCFAEEADARFFVGRGLAEMMSEREVEAFFAEMRGEPDPVDPEPVEVQAPAPRRGRGGKRGK